MPKDDITDKLLSWISTQEYILKSAPPNQFNKGLKLALLEVRTFLLTDGKLSSKDISSKLVVGPGKD